MKKQIFKLTLVAASAALILTACTKDLDRLPTNSVTAESVYKDVSGYKQVLAKIYGSMAMTGNSGPAGNPDIPTTIIDEGTSDFVRLLWKAQELSTDEAVVAWGDPGIQDFHNMNWSSDNPMLKGLYYRSMYQITLVNDFIRQSTDAKLSERGISGADAAQVVNFRAEARFLRAMQYALLMDLFGNPPHATEATLIGSAPPPRIARNDLFTYVESELKAIENDLVDARSNEYGRADKAAAWALLARIYLNAQVYTGTAKYTEAITYAKKVIDAGYTLTPDYRELFLADNHLNKNEFILTVNYDGIKTQTWGGTTFLAHASVGGSMNAGNYGIDGGWGGIRTTKNIPNLFPDVTGAADKRSQFYTSGQNIEISSLTTFTDGYAITKYRNKKKDNSNGSNATFVDIDFPLFRLAEMYLIYAEAVLRGGAGGDAALALGYINALRTRAYGNASGNITAPSLTLDFIIAERGRELYWEGFRRTDLIRFDRFTEGTYLWPWKGGVAAGQGVQAFRKLYPIPSSDLVTNPNLVQNTGY